MEALPNLRTNRTRDGRAAAQQTAPTDNRRVAILDDHPSFAEALSMSLPGFPDLECVGTSRSISDFIDLCLELEPDVLLIDFQLRDGTALDCSAALSQAGLDARLILLTAHSRPGIRAAAIDAGFEQVLAKELPLRVIAEAVRHPVDGAHTQTGDFRPIRFSRRQREVLDLMGQGLDPASIAEALFISIHTARTHVKDVLKLLGAPSQLAAVMKAIQLGYLLPPSTFDDSWGCTPES